MSTTTAQRTGSVTGAANAGYRTLWRWHFYAGLFVMPFLIVLAITGTLYCFQPQLEPLLYPHRLVVEPRATPRLPEDVLLARARAALPPTAKALTAEIGTAPKRSAEFIFRLADGDKESVYVNPFSGEVLGTLSVEHRLMQVVRMLHRKLLLGKAGELLMELAACWTLVMLGTGVALWWPRGGATLRSALKPRFTLKGRALWKNLHTVMGIWLALGALAFVLTGLPWSGSWGKQFKALATASNLGAPPGAWGGLPLRSALPGAPVAPVAPVAELLTTSGAVKSATGHDLHREHRAQADDADTDTNTMPGMVMDDLPLRQTPWAVGDAPVPASRSSARTANPLPPGRVVQIVASLGITDRYSLVLPDSATGVYSVSYFPADPRAERTLYIDQYSGAVLRDIRYRDYGAVSKAVSFGTSLHMGRLFGLANQLICAAISLGLAAMAVTGCVMWWKRRPSGSLGAPARERGKPPLRGWRSALVLLGVIFPLMGATLLAVWLADWACFGRAKKTA
ncbi:PepSY domain-containing protein [Paraburkholderia sp. PREW-6R]|uniref:PepSY-associated TM helix domain-containing protein n=1 Tax=Paraburkholderia sp. PREW-6R TaxID=3141544 RepID=UPI0031F50AD1